jgi:inorganic pyrophosphatase
LGFEYEFKDGQLRDISPWHDIPLWADESKNYVHFICEIPKWTRAKYEIATKEQLNPIKQDVKNGRLRFYQHGDMMFNYGCLPQTWEDPDHVTEDTGCKGDNDPIDAVEVGIRQIKTGGVIVVCSCILFFIFYHCLVQSYWSARHD